MKAGQHEKDDMTASLRTHRWLLIVAALMALFLAACGDDDDGGSSGGDSGSSAGEQAGGSDEPGLTSDQAATIAAAALLTVDDLPDAAWEVTETSGDQSSNDNPFIGVPECEPLADLLADDPEEPLAQQGRDFQTSSGGLDQAQYSAEVSVFANSDAVSETLATAQEALDPDTLGPCFETAFSTLLSGGQDIEFEVTDVKVSEPGFVLDDSAAIAMSMNIGAQGITFGITMEIHIIGRDQVGATLLILDLNSDLATGAAEATLEAFEGRIRAALDAE